MQEEHNTEYHIISYNTYILIWLSLMVFTIVTVAVAGLNLAKLTVVVALFIATIKTSLVLLYFMHLKYERSVFKIMVLVTVITLGIFIGLTFFDVLFR